MITADLLALARWLSPSFPTGAFAWSHGLEQAIASGLEAEEVERWVADVVRLGAGRTDAILLSQAARGGPVADLAELAEALSPTAERLAETREQGAAFARTVSGATPVDLPALPLPVAVGHLAHLKALPAEQVAALYLQAFATNLVQAAQRLAPIGQTKGAAMMERLAPICEAVAVEAATAALDDIGSSALLGDIASARHETLEPRLFRS